MFSPFKYYFKLYQHTNYNITPINCQYIFQKNYLENSIRLFKQSCLPISLAKKLILEPDIFHRKLLAVKIA